MGLNRYRLGDLIELCEARNDDLQYGIEDVKGVSIQKIFIDTKANMEGVSLNPYYLVQPDDFVYVTVTSRNGEKITLAHNVTEKTYIVSSSYIVFKVKKTDLLLSDYLFMYFNRPEFDRYSRYNSWGSARETFDWSEMCAIEIDLPPLAIQQKYVDVYNAMIANQQCYERGLEDLKVACDAYIEELRRKMPSEKLGPYLRECNEKNEGNRIKLFQGVNVEHEFTDPKRIAEDSENGSVVRTGQFAFNKVMKAHNTKLPIALREGADCVVSNSYQVFEISNTDKLIPQYLLLWMNRAETQRHAGFISFGTTRDIFTFKDMGELSIPIPSIEIQKSIVDIYKVYLQRKAINERLKEQIKSICPILIKGSLEEARKKEV